MYRVLVIEDDEALNEGICWALRQEGYEAAGARQLSEAARLCSPPPDLLLLDVNLPDGDGRDFLKRLRKERETPVILLTALDTERDMLKGFDAGCDDYMTKPFSMPVLLKKIRALFWRIGGPKGEERYESGGLVYDFAAKRLVRDGTPVSLTATEIRLLEYFLRNRNRALTRQQILASVWDAYENYVDEKTLNVNIRRLREKIGENSGQPAYIRTLFGIGYQWDDIDRQNREHS